MSNEVRELWRRFHSNVALLNCFFLYFLLLLSLKALATNPLPCDRAIISITNSTAEQVHYKNYGDTTHIFYFFNTRCMEGDKTGQEIEFLKLDDHQITGTPIASIENGTVTFKNHFDQFASIIQNDRNMTLVLKNMNQMRDGYYRIVISNDEHHFLNHTTLVQKIRDACTDELRGPLTKKPVKNNHWPHKISTVALCLAGHKIIKRNQLCVDEHPGLVELRFRFKYFENPEEHIGKTTGVIFYRGIDNSGINKPIISTDTNGVVYIYKKYLGQRITAQLFYAEDGVALILNYKNNTMASSREDYEVHVRVVGGRDQTQSFSLLTDIKNNGCSSPGVTTFQPADYPTTPQNTITINGSTGNHYGTPTPDESDNNHLVVKVVTPVVSIAAIIGVVLAIKLWRRHHSPEAPNDTFELISGE